MKIENLVEKDTVLDDDYLIVNGTDGTKKAKKSNFLSELNSRLNLMSVFHYDSNTVPGDDACKNAILASPHDVRPCVILVKNTDGRNECLYGYDVGEQYSAYILISWYRGVKFYREELGGTFVIRDIVSLQ